MHLTCRADPKLERIQTQAEFVGRDNPDSVFQDVTHFLTLLGSKVTDPKQWQYDHNTLLVALEVRIPLQHLVTVFS